MAADVGTLDPLEELVTQFCAVTGADRATGHQMLEIHNGNLEMAIGMHMDQEEGVGADRIHPSSSIAKIQSGNGLDFGAAAMASGQEEDLNGIRAPIPQRREVLVEEGPKLTGFRGMRRARRSVFDGFRDFQAEANRVTTGQQSGKQQSYSDSRDSTLNTQQENLMVTGQSFAKKHTLEDLFRPPVDLTYKGTLRTARETGMSQNKWLMVNIQNVQEFACQVLNRDVWSNLTVKTLVKKNFIFWQVYHDSEEGKKYMQFYKVHGWPHVAVLDPITGENLVTWDKVEISSFTDLIREFIAEHPSPENPDEPRAKRQKRTNSIVDASEEAQLEAAIKASLSSDNLQALPSSSASTMSITSATTTTAVCINIDSDQSDYASDDLETFTGSENESSDTPFQSGTGICERSSLVPRRNFSAISDQIPLSQQNDSVSSAAAAAEVSSSQQILSASAEDTSLPSTSGNRDIVRVVEDSENENSLGFRESYANTPNSVDILGSRSSEFYTLDSSSSSNSYIDTSSLATLDNDEDTVPSLKFGTETEREDALAPGSPAWKQHYGDAADPATNLIFRFPDGQKEQLSLPCTSKLKALFAFCTSKGFGQDSYELVVNFPRRTLSSLDPGSTVQEAKLHPQETIFVQAR